MHIVLHERRGLSITTPISDPQLCNKANTTICRNESVLHKMCGAATSCMSRAEPDDILRWASDITHMETLSQKMEIVFEDFFFRVKSKIPW